MLRVDCQICKDPLGGPDRQPVAMPCGHMYCEDCATFWFNSGEGKKCFCGKAFRGDQIVRLWTESPSEGDDKENGKEKVEEKDTGRLVEECQVQLEEGGDGGVVLALQRVQKAVDGIVLDPEDAGVKNILRDVRQALQSIKDTLSPKAPAPAPQPTPEHLQTLQTTQRALRGAAQQLAHERAYAHAQISGFRSQIASLTTRMKELERRCGELEKRCGELEEYRARERERRDRVKGLEEENGVLVGRVESATRSVTRWRKKYYAVKQAIAAQKLRTQDEAPVVEVDNGALIILD